MIRKCETHYLRDVKFIWRVAKDRDVIARGRFGERKNERETHHVVSKAMQFRGGACNH